MIIPMSPERIVGLIRCRFRLVLAGGVLSALGALLLGLMTPYLFPSEATVQFARSSKTVGAGDEGDVYRIVNLARSTKVLGKVAVALAKDPNLELQVVAPQSLSTLDVGYRFGLLSASLTGAKPPPSNRVPASVPPDILEGFLDRNLRLVPNTASRTLRLIYEAGDPEVARRVCREISEAYVVASTESEKDDITLQENYFDSSIKLQLESIKQTEAKMREIVEHYPEIGALKDDQRGTGSLARKFSDKREMLRRLESELQANTSILDSIRKELSPGALLKGRFSADLGDRLEEEIGELELKLLQYTRFGGYGEDHPEVKAINERIAILTRIFNAQTVAKDREVAGLNEVAGDGLSLKELMKQRLELRERNRRLAVEHDFLKREIAEQSSSFKEVVRVNFEFEALARELNSNVAVTNELYKELQRTRLMKAALAPSVKLIVPANLQVHPVNTSVRKRTIFSFFIGVTLVMSMLLLLDLVSPVLLSLEDLALIGAKHFGKFRIGDRSFAQIAHCLVSLGASSAKPGMKAGKVAVFWQLANRLNFETLKAELLDQLSKYGYRVGIIHVGDGLQSSDVDETEAVKGKSVPTVRLAAESVPSKFAPLVEVMRSRWDWVFVISSIEPGSPTEMFLAKNTDYFFYISEVGESELKPMKRLMEVPGTSPQLQHYVLPFVA